MMNDFMEYNWFSYLETPRQASGPVKLDQILTERMEAFLRARKVRPYHIRYRR